MGSDNLNRVFIKAYGKGVANNAAGSEATASQESLIVRFDTATVQIPAPHMLTVPRQPAQLVAAPKLAPQPARATQEVVPSVPANTATEPELTQWDETMISILFGGSTMVAPSTSINSARRQTRRNQDAPAELKPQPMQVASQSSHESKAPTKVEAIQSAPAPVVTTASEVVAGPSTSKSNSTESRTPILENSKSDLTQKIAAMNQSGEIFRLDRPSYAETASSTRSAMAKEYYEVDESSQTAFDIELQQVMMAGSTVPTAPVVSKPAPVASKPAPSVAPPAPSVAPRAETIGNSRSRTMEKTKRREQVLRQARIKIFNPLWEVDRLEWPAVCSELSRNMDEGSAGVVDNLLRACQAGLQVLAVTSPQSGEGTSTVACCLAMLAGKHGLNTALVDSNIENPSLSYQTNLDLEVDWNDAVSKRMPLEEIAVQSVDDQVTLVPLLERLNAPELNEQNVAMMLQELSQSFDLVIVDLGHMSAQGNLVRKLGELGVINAVVAVVDRRLSSPERIEMCLRQIRQTGIASIGLVENFAA